MNFSAETACHALAIIRTVAHIFNVPVATVMSQTKARRFVEARAVSIGIILHAEPADWSLKRLGTFFLRDHTTILYNRNLYRKWCDQIGLSWECKDVAARAELIARHLGYDPLPLTQSYIGHPQPAFNSSTSIVEEPEIDSELSTEIYPPSFSSYELPADQKLARFVQIYLVADLDGEVNVPTLGQFYRQYCAERGETPLPMAQFGAELLRMVIPDGCRRRGPMLSGLKLRNPKCLRIKTPPKATLLPEPTVPSRWLSTNGRTRGGSIVIMEDDGSIARYKRDSVNL